MSDSPYGDHLPIFPMLNAPYTEERIERAVERLVDRADTAFMAGKATQEQYDAWNAALNKWANRQHDIRVSERHDPGLVRGRALIAKSLM